MNKVKQATKLTKIENWKHNWQDRKEVTTYDKGKVVVKEETSLGKYDKVRELIATDTEIDKMFPYSANTRVRAEIGISSKYEEPYLYHKRVFLDGWESIIESEYTCDVKELLEEYLEWWESYVFIPDSKSQLNKSWGNELGGNIVYDIAYRWKYYCTKKVRDIRHQERMAKRQEEEDAKVSVFDKISEVV